MAKIVIAAGGTGGHIVPAMAVADVLLQQQHDITWFGTRGELEKKLLKDRYHFHALRVKGLRAKGWRSLLVAPLRLVQSFMESLAILRKQRPDTVLAMGGYVCGPVAMAAWFMRIPLIIHEQNARPGLTNRILSHFSRHIFCAFPDTFKSYSSKTTVIGNPIRASLMHMASPLARLNEHGDELHLLILGGSQGAASINQTCIQAWIDSDAADLPHIWHQTGAKHYQHMLSLYQRNGIAARVDPFIDDMEQAYDWADLVICRSGAMTVSELAAVGLASILIPFPYAVDDHQYFNAKFLEAQGAAHIILDKDLSADGLFHILNEYKHHRTHLVAMALKAKRCGGGDAALKLAMACVSYESKLQRIS